MHWLTPPTDDPEFVSQVQAVCEVYLQAPALREQGVRVVATDEKSGMQAVERAYPTKPVRPGMVEKREFEYIRHGTRCLIASLEVATGKLLAPMVGPTRAEEDFLAHVQAVVAHEPEARWVFVADNLDTHRSESLVRWVAEQEGYEGDLGIKYKSGSLKSKKTRSAFLAAPERRIRFVYTPKHCSWLNQIELWFSHLARKLLRRGSFSSVEALTEAVLAFIRYYNQTKAKPYKWTYTGRPLQA